MLLQDIQKLSCTYIFFSGWQSSCFLLTELWYRFSNFYFIFVIILLFPLRELQEDMVKMVLEVEGLNFTYNPIVVVLRELIWMGGGQAIGWCRQI